MVPPASAPAPPVTGDRQHDVETPEHVAIGYELADLGSRFTALLLDGILLTMALMGLLGLLLGGYSLMGESAGGSLVAAVVVITGFALAWGYFIAFEGLRDGQTPGKRWMGIRVVQDGGYPLTLRAAAVRNLLRVVDIQPMPSWMLGGFVMMLHPQTKRIGDLAAGTVVVRDRAGQPIPEAAPAADAVVGPPRLSDDEFRALSTYAARRGELDPHVRAGLARKLIVLVGPHYEGDPRRGHHSPDGFLVVAHAEEAERRRAAGGGGRAGSALATAMVRRQRRGWDEYTALLERARKRGLDRLDEREVSRFATLYREIAADLARARTYAGSPELLYWLERMVGAGHNLLYRRETSSWQAARTWVGSGFPRLVRKRWRPIAAGAVLFYLPALITFAAVRMDPPLGRQMLHPEMQARVEEAPGKEARGEGYVEIPEVHMPVFATSLIANNVQVTFMAFAGGIAAGLGTVAILLLNGLHLGSVAGAFANEGVSLHLWTFVLPHGVVELTAICIAGGAGLWMGSALFLPGRRTRREVLVERARDGVSLIGGTTVLLVIAGLIEGFISPSTALPREAKLALAGLFAALLVAYLVLGGRAPGVGERAPR